MTNGSSAIARVAKSIGPSRGTAVLSMSLTVPRRASGGLANRGHASRTPAAWGIGSKFLQPSLWGEPEISGRLACQLTEPDTEVLSVREPRHPTDLLYREVRSEQEMLGAFDPSEFQEPDAGHTGSGSEDMGEPGSRQACHAGERLDGKFLSETFVDIDHDVTNPIFGYLLVGKAMLPNSQKKNTLHRILRKEELRRLDRPPPDQIP